MDFIRNQDDAASGHPVDGWIKKLYYALCMSRPLDRLTLLETFARIADRGSISAAARDLGLSQASASRQLKDLEERFGGQLVRRTTHALALTPAGQDLLHDARELIAAWEAVEERHAGHGPVRGALKVVAPVALGQLHLADIALRFQMQHPEISLSWQLEDHPIRFAEVGCDCWIKIGTVPDDRLIVRPLGRVERLLVASPTLVGDREIAGPEDAEGLPLAALAPFEGGRIRLTDRNGMAVEIAPTVRVTTNNIFSVRRAALMGVGAAVLPRWFVEDDLASGALVDLLADWRAATLDINVAFLPARRQPKRLAIFLDALRSGVRAIPGVQPPA